MVNFHSSLTIFIHWWFRFGFTSVYVSILNETACTTTWVDHEDEKVAIIFINILTFSKNLFLNCLTALILYYCQQSIYCILHYCSSSSVLFIIIICFFQKVFLPPCPVRELYGLLTSLYLIITMCSPFYWPLQTY